MQDLDGQWRYFKKSNHLLYLLQNLNYGSFEIEPIFWNFYCKILFSNHKQFRNETKLILLISIIMPNKYCKLKIGSQKKINLQLKIWELCTFCLFFKNLMLEQCKSLYLFFQFLLSFDNLDCSGSPREDDEVHFGTCQNSADGEAQTRFWSGLHGECGPETTDSGKDKY